MAIPAEKLKLVEEQQRRIKENLAAIAVRLTTVYDDYEHDPRLWTGWGFSCLVEVGDRKVLFDTGADRMIEMFNIERLEIDLKQVGAIFLSHAHCDHGGGLTSVLEAASGPKVYLGLRSPLSLKERVRSSGGEPVAVKGLTQVFENAHSTGEMGGSIREQSMVVRTTKGLVVITGCAHPGIVEIARRVKEQFKEKIHLMLEPTLARRFQRANNLPVHRWPRYARPNKRMNRAPRRGAGYSRDRRLSPGRVVRCRDQHGHQRSEGPRCRASGALPLHW